MNTIFSLQLWPIALMAANAISCFISGLRFEIRHDVVALRPISMAETVALAKLYEEKYTTLTNQTLGSQDDHTHHTNQTLNINLFKPRP